MSSLPLTCPICLDVLHRPVTVPCGHSYCLQCVLKYWDTEGDAEGGQQAPRCPQCRQRFEPWPRLAVNTVLAQLADTVRENEHRGRVVECECSKKTREASGGRSLVEDITTHQRNVSEDRRGECEELLVADGNILQREVLQALRDTEQLLRHLLCLIGPTRSELQTKTSTKNQQEHPGQTQNQQGPLVQTQNQEGLLVQTQHQEGHPNFSNSPAFLTNISSAVSEFWQKFQALVSEERTYFHDPTPAEPHPCTRDELLQYSFSISLDQDTANSKVCLSRSNMRATLRRDPQKYGEHPKRFMDCTQVLSKENLSGRSYLEVEWSGWGFYLALASKKIPRSGEESRFGQGERSWALHCEKTGYELLHRGVCRSLSGPHSSRVAVFLDQVAGRLSFYSLSSHSLHLLHTTSTGSMEPLALGVRLYSVGDYVEFCRPQEE